MHIIRLIHWNEGEMAPHRTLLRRAGFRVEWSRIRSQKDLAAIRRDPPDAIVIDLTRLPSLGRDVGLWLRRTKATRRVPLLFAGGEPGKVSPIRRLLPDAVFCPWPRMISMVRRSIARPPDAPVVPGSAMAGYASTPLQKKLGIGHDSSVVLLNAPPDFHELLGDLPPDVTVSARPSAGADVTVWFLTSTRELRRMIDRMAETAGARKLWLAWPKAASGLPTDLSQTLVREAGLAAGLVDYKIASIDRIWSGLLFTRRKTGRPLSTKRSA